MQQSRYHYVAVVNASVAEKLERERDKAQADADAYSARVMELRDEIENLKERPNPDAWMDDAPASFGSRSANRDSQC